MPITWIVVREEDCYGNRLTPLAVLPTEQQAKRLVRRLADSYVRRGDWSGSIRFDAYRRLPPVEEGGSGLISQLDWKVYFSVQTRRQYMYLHNWTKEKDT